MSQPVDLVTRICEYAKKTDVDLALSTRHNSWTHLGLPDVRGFCPHLRRVNLAEEQKMLAEPGMLRNKALEEVQSGKAADGLWLLHDLLHIAFYDFANHHLGDSLWNEKERFLENHLASEFFAVLLLDYHFLVHTPVQGLTVSLDGGQWSALKNEGVSLPPLKSQEFAKLLFDLYFLGKSPTEPGTPSVSLQRWLGHEQRYTRKQRVYTLQWWEDLQGLSPSGEEAKVEDSEVIHGIWELLSLFTASEKAWGSYVKDLKPPKNSFAGLKKYDKMPSSFDFRFTDTLCLNKKDLLVTLQENESPTASDLFLMWQILTTFSPTRFDRRTQESFTALAEAANQGNPPLTLWNDVKTIVKSALQGPHFKPPKIKKETVGTFFLP